MLSDVRSPALAVSPDPASAAPADIIITLDTIEVYEYRCT